jgi:hypothetical protein
MIIYFKVRFLRNTYLLFMNTACAAQRVKTELRFNTYMALLLGLTRETAACGGRIDLSASPF